jgi:hypothetical protein
MSTSTVDSTQVFQITINQNMNAVATSSGSYLSIFLPPIVQISSGFNANTDCQIQGVANSCVVTFTQTSNYLQINVQGSSTYLSNNPNIFPFGSYITIYLKNLNFPYASTAKTAYPVYLALYASNVVNPVTYYAVQTVSADPVEDTLSGLGLTYLSNYYTATAANYQTYPGVLRLKSTTPSQLNLVVQPNQQLVITFYAKYGFRSITSLKNMDTYPCTSNIGVSCQYF